MKFNVTYEPVYSNDVTGLVTLNREYIKQDSSFFTRHRMHRVRDKWMKKLIKENQPLTCWICGKINLKPFIDDKNQLATLDHYIPVSVNLSKWNDPNNFKIACHHCNSNRGNKLL